MQSCSLVWFLAHSVAENWWLLLDAGQEIIHDEPLAQLPHDLPTQVKGQPNLSKASKENVQKKRHQPTGKKMTVKSQRPQTP